MALARRDDYLTDAQGRALAGAQVYYCAPQPANTSVIPPSPLADAFSDLTGTPESNPQITDGFGHAVAYLDDSFLYTIVYVHPLFGPNPIVLKDQSIGGGGGSAGATLFAGVPQGTIDGANKVFLLTDNGTPLTALPTQAVVWLNFPLINGLGYSLALVGGHAQLTYANAPEISDNIYAQGQL